MADSTPAESGAVRHFNVLCHVFTVDAPSSNSSVALQRVPSSPAPSPWMRWILQPPG